MNAYRVGCGCQEQLQSRRLTLDLTNLEGKSGKYRKVSPVGTGMDKSARIAVC